MHNNSFDLMIKVLTGGTELMIVIIKIIIPFNFFIIRSDFFIFNLTVELK